MTGECCHLANNMNQESLFRICDLVGGQSRLDCMIGVTYSTMRRKCKGESEITKGDDLKVRQAVSELIEGLEKAIAA
jgi:DNA-binding transcriptional regulator YdaS (Cro superfamily)